MYRVVQKVIPSQFRFIENTCCVSKNNDISYVDYCRTRTRHIKSLHWLLMSYIVVSLSTAAFIKLHLFVSDLKSSRNY